MKDMDAISRLRKAAPEVGVILGSGLAAFADMIEEIERVPFAALPGLKAATAPGHEGCFILGRVGSKTVLVQKGRLHFYEGHALDEVVAPVRLMHELGIQSLVLSNAAGGINLDFQSGDLMMITDHINFTGRNPLVGPKREGEWRFTDMSFAYDPAYRALLQKTAEAEGIDLKEGVYLGCSGPSYETPAEIRAFRLWGADAVGMSTVPEVIVANALGMRVAAVSCITNMAAGILPVRLTEEEVLENGARATDRFSRLIYRFIASIDEAPRHEC